MSNRILTKEGWQQRIRDKMGVDIAYLPDSVMEQPDCITIAEFNIIKQLPDYTVVSDDGIVYLEAAVVCECAILLCTGMSARLPRKETGPHAGHELNTDWNKKKTDLEMERDGYVYRVLEIDFPDSLPPNFYRFRITYPKREWE